MSRYGDKTSDNTHNTQKVFEPLIAGMSYNKLQIFKAILQKQRKLKDMEQYNAKL